MAISSSLCVSSWKENDILCVDNVCRDDVRVRKKREHAHTHTPLCNITQKTRDASKKTNNRFSSFSKKYGAAESSRVSFFTIDIVWISFTHRSHCQLE